MNKDKLWEEVFKPAMLQFLKDKIKKYKEIGYVPTLELLIEELEEK